MIVIEIDDQQVRAALNELARRASPAGLRGVLKAIGEDLEESTKKRFDTSTAPARASAPARPGTSEARRCVCSAVSGLSIATKAALSAPRVRSSSAASRNE